MTSPSQYEQFKQKVAIALVELEAISPDTLDVFGADHIIKKIARDFKQADREKEINPWRIVSDRIKTKMAKSGVTSQTDLALLMSRELEFVRSPGVFRWAVHRMLNAGERKIDLIEGMAICRVLGCKVEDLSPWTYWGKNDDGE